MQAQVKSHMTDNQEKSEIQQQKSEIVAALIRLLQHGDEVDRCYAIKTLVQLEEQSAIPAIIERLGDEDIDVCIDAAEALGQLQSEEAIDTLMQLLLEDPDGEVKTMATKSLGLIGLKTPNQSILDALMNVAQNRPEDMDWSSNDDWDDWWDIQKEAVIALGNLRCEAAIPLFVEMLRDEYSQDIQVELLKALASIGGKADKKLIGLLELDSFPQKISQKLTNADKNFRRRLVGVLAYSDSEKTLKALGKSLTDPYPEIRAEAISALAKRGADSFIPPILLMLRDPVADVKESALRAINQLANAYDAESSQSQDLELDAEQLIQLLQQNHETLQLTIMKTLAGLIKKGQLIHHIDELSEASQALLRRCLVSQNISIIGTAAAILGHLKDSHSLNYLIQLFENKESFPLVRQEVVRAVSHFYHEESQARDLVNQALYDEQPSVRLAAADSLLFAQNQWQTAKSEGIAPESNEQHEDAENDSVQDDYIPPMEVLLAVIRGEQVQLSSNPDTKNASTKDASIEGEALSESADKTQDQEAVQAIKEQFAEQKIPESPTLIPDNEETVRESMSTLDAIAMDNVESALAMQVDSDQNQADTSQSTERPDPVALIDRNDQELSPFVDVIQTNKRVARNMRRKKVDVADDARYISLKLCAQNQQPEYSAQIMETLNSALNDEDAQMRCEAAKAIAVMSQHQSDLLALNYSFGKLLTLLDSPDEEMRLACIDAIGKSQNRAALAHLLVQLDAEHYIVAIHSLAAIQRIVHDDKQLSEQQREEFMNNDELSDEQLIASVKPLLTHSQYSVRMAAVELLIELNTEEMIPVYIEVALSGQAQLSHKVAHLLSEYVPQTAIQVLLEKLSKAPNSGLRRHMMEMLAILFNHQSQKMSAA